MISAPLLLDTHVLIWMITGSNRLGKKAVKFIEQAFSGDKVFVSAISFWEIALLKSRNKINIPISARELHNDVISIGIHEIPMDANIAINSVLIKNMHADSADRIIMATAQTKNCILVTRDGQLLQNCNGLKTIDAGH